MALTLNQVIQRFQTYSDNHFMVNHFYYGNVTEFLENGEVDYVACFLELLGTDISRTNRNTIYKFRLWFADLENVSIQSGESNQDIESDLTQIAQDYVSLMQFDSDANSDFQASTEATLQYYREKFNDVVIAVSLDITIATKYAANRCQVPTNIPPETKSFVYYGYKSDAGILTQSQILSSSRILIDNGSNFEISFAGSGEPAYLWFAQPSTEPIKTEWEDMVNTINSGNIGGETDLFGSFSTVGQFDYVQTNYKTQQENSILFRI